ncbi:MAG: hypothetical protein AAGF53_11505 [Pseudomonadota bacterium]
MLRSLAARKSLQERKILYGNAAEKAAIDAPRSEDDDGKDQGADKAKVRCRCASGRFVETNDKIEIAGMSATKRSRELAFAVQGNYCTRLILKCFSRSPRLRPSVALDTQAISNSIDEPMVYRTSPA